MGYFQSYNVNPKDKSVGDCVIRALSVALGQSWEETYDGIAAKGREMCDMPSANAVWGAYLRDKGFRRYVIPNYLPDDYSVEDFCYDNPFGVYVLALDGHVVAVIDGKYYDSWESGEGIPQYYWHKD